MSRSSNLPVLVPGEGPRTERRQRTRFVAKPAQAGLVDAQLLGQDGEKRGLKGGGPVMDAAREAYLETEWSGEADRRLPAGLRGYAKV